MVKMVKRTQEPVVIFTEFRDSLAALAHSLSHVRRCSVLHGGLTTAERSTHLDAFLRGDSTVLLATDVAAQGLNLQHRARWVVSLDVPWSPARLEQRIGRVDRIGQRHAVHVTVLAATHASETRLLAHLTSRVDTARRALGQDILPIVPPSGPLKELLTRRPRQRHTRQAVAHARILTVRRTLAARWRIGLPDTPGMSLPRRRHGWGARAGTSVVLFSVPLIDGNGSTVELMLSAATVPSSVARTCSDDLSAHLSRLVEQRLASRIRRLRRSAGPRVARWLDVEKAIAREWLHTAPELQPALFDRVVQRQIDAARDERHDHVQSFAARIRYLERSIDLQAGALRVEMIFVGFE
jgi:hypothetical protein